MKVRDSTVCVRKLEFGDTRPKTVMLEEGEDKAGKVGGDSSQKSSCHFRAST